MRAQNKERKRVESTRRERINSQSSRESKVGWNKESREGAITYVQTFCETWCLCVRTAQICEEVRLHCGSLGDFWSPRFNFFENVVGQFVVLLVRYFREEEKHACVQSL